MIKRTLSTLATILLLFSTSTQAVKLLTEEDFNIAKMHEHIKEGTEHVTLFIPSYQVKSDFKLLGTKCQLKVANFKSSIASGGNPPKTAYQGSGIEATCEGTYSFTQTMGNEKNSDEGKYTCNVDNVAITAILEMKSQDNKAPRTFQVNDVSTTFGNAKFHFEGKLGQAAETTVSLINMENFLKPFRDTIGSSVKDLLNTYQEVQTPAKASTLAQLESKLDLKERKTDALDKVIDDEVKKEAIREEKKEKEQKKLIEIDSSEFSFDEDAVYDQDQELNDDQIRDLVIAEITNGVKKLMEADLSNEAMINTEVSSESKTMFFGKILSKVASVAKNVVRHNPVLSNITQAVGRYAGPIKNFVHQNAQPALKMLYSSIGKPMLRQFGCVQ